MKYKLLHLIFIPYLIFSQELPEKEHYTYFDEIINLQNTDLSNGVFHKEKYRTINGNHHYYKVNKFFLGKVHYNNDVFSNTLIKYDLNNDNIIIKISNSSYLIFILKKSLVKKFTIDNDIFINIADYGYSQILIDKKPIKLYKKNLINSYEKLNKKFSYTKFVNKSKYFINYNSEYFYVLKKKNLIKKIPQQKKIISEFYLLNKKLAKNNSDLFFTKLINLLNNNVNNAK
ncbi:hypothetical protein PG913_07845 [Tenacibaculum pacificus]|uniref:hypothetical protein n=1 Tax=Tenacibaculum pacificus TaxID=3018314 RepID=UPI0022F3D4CD|nr:hypothetical protein [Tenacibaculum pacificus]WBX72818.1 hypothetical protein PG913_07845 [Tenacibaculum pacificus]